MNNDANIPNTLYVIEIKNYVFITGVDMLESCKDIPCYRFDNQTDVAFKACEEIAMKRGKKVADIVRHHPWLAAIYDPKEKLQESKMMSILDAEKNYVQQESETVKTKLPNILA